MGRYRVLWSPKARAHVWRRHGIALEELQMVEADPRATIRHARKGRYIITGAGKGSRLISEVVERRKGRPGEHRGVTARPATPPEIALYHGD